MASYILSFSDQNATLETVGGKGMSLSKLSRAGLPVPGGFHVCTDAYRCFVDQNGIQSQIMEALKNVDASDPLALEPVSRAIAGFFGAGQIPAEIAEEIRAAYAMLNGVPVAVRSSATAEDLPEASFAGQQDTFLNVDGPEAVLDAVKKCWASLWTARAIAYRSRQGIGIGAVAQAVVVQKMVFAEAAGVMFTANPVTGKRDEILVTAAWGLGEALVAGAVTPDTLTLAKKTGKIIRREIAQKMVMTIRMESGTREAAVPDAKKAKAVLSNLQAAELARLGLEIEKLYGIPMDIEWTLLDNRFAIVQARPITALPEVLDWPLPHPKAMLARGSFAEFVPEPVSTLFATLAIPIARKTTARLMNMIGQNDEISYLMEVLNDYVYIGFVFSPRMIWSMMKASVKMIGPIIKNTGQRAIEARATLVAVAAKWQVRDLMELSAADMLSGVEEIFTETAQYYNMAQSGTIPVAMGSEMSFGAFYNLLVRRKQDPLAEAFLFGTENHAMRMEKELHNLAIWLGSQPGLAEHVKDSPAADLAREIIAGQPWEEFSARFRAILDEYGHAIYDLDFAKPTPAEEPTPMIESIKVYLAGKNDPHERQRAALEMGEKASERICKRLDPLRRKYFLKLLKWAQETAPMRENSIADLGLGHPQIRRMLGELGRRFTAGGAITRAEDVYWLEAGEAAELAVRIDQGRAMENFSGRVEERKTKWQTMRRIIPPNTLPRVRWLAWFFADNEQSGKQIKGFGASAGIVKGRACVMLGPEDFGRLEAGDILVTGITTPAWTPLFARAAGIVTDIGGPLSHSSIVAREYGIPAVLATGVATRRIKNGQMVTVDGTKGTVTIE